jgi:hypothetical protein
MSSQVQGGGGEDITNFERFSDVLLGLAFLAIALVSAKRMSWSVGVGGSETTAVHGLLLSILLTSSLRATWFLIPNSVWQPSYTPSAVIAFQPDPWVGTF